MQFHDDSGVAFADFFFVIGVAKEGKQNPVHTERRLYDIRDIAFVGDGVDICHVFAAGVGVLRQVIVSAVGNAPKFAPAEREFEFEVGGGFGIKRQFFFVVVAEFEIFVFDAEAEQEVRDIVKENLDAITDEFGDLSTDEIVDRVLEEIANGLEGGLDTASAPVVSLSARAGDTEEASEAEEKLESNISGYIRSYLVGESSTQIFFYFTIAAFVLTAISMLSWLYLLIKVFVKGFTMNPAVKLKAPILFLGWLPALVFFIIPTAAFMAVNALGGIGALAGESLTMIGGVSFFTSGLIALAAAVLLIILFIPYGIIRKKLKLELASRITPQEEAAYISANPALVPQEPVVMEHTVSDETDAANDDLYESSDENAPDGTDND